MSKLFNIERLTGGHTVEAEGYCTVHGHYVTYVFVSADGTVRPPMCPHCADLALEAKREEEARQEKALRDKILREQMLRFVAESKIPTSYTEKSFDSYTPQNDAQRAAVASVRSWARDVWRGSCSKPWLVLTGSVGVGKTHLACAAMNALTPYVKSMLYTRAVKMVQSVTDTWRRGADTSALHVLNTYANAELLCIDELGGDRCANRAAKDVIFDVLESRYAETGRPTIICTNLDVKALEGFVEAATFSRICQLSTFVQLTGADFRKRGMRGDMY